MNTLILNAGGWVLALVLAEMDMLTNLRRDLSL